MNPTPTKWSTDDAAGRRGIEYWNELLCEQVIGLDIDSEVATHFNGYLAAAPLGEAQSFMIAAGHAQHVVHEFDHSRPASQDDSFIVIHMRRGRIDLQTHSNAVRIETGDTVVLSAAERFEFESPAGTTSMVLRFDNSVIQQSLPHIHACLGERIAGNRNWGTTLSSALWNIDPHEVASWQHHPEEVSDQVVGLLGLALAPSPAAKPRLQRDIYQRLLNYLDARYREPAITPGDVALELGISKRYLHEIIARHGTTFNKLLYAKRIDYASRRLRDPRRSEQSITEIAFACGFANSAHFSRVFRRRLGMSPREYRELQ